MVANQTVHNSAQSLQSSLEQLKRSNDWQAIYELVQPVENLYERSPEVWQNSKVLSSIGFACTKLAAISSQDLPRDRRPKERFLEEKKAFRNRAKDLYKRCLELEPENVTYLAGLAYVYYDSVQEIRNRVRKENAVSEANQGLNYYRRILEINPNHLKSLYRAGYLLTDVLSNRFLPGISDEEARSNRDQGIETLHTLIETWEALNPEELAQKEERARCRAEYVKAFYQMGSAHLDQVKDWDVGDFALVLHQYISGHDSVVVNPRSITNAEKAWQYYYRCMEIDQSGNNQFEEVDKLYSLGKAAFIQYWVLTGDGQQNNTPRAIEWRNTGEEFLEKALQAPWSIERQSQKKDHIAERLARVYITTQNYEKAIRVIQKNIRNLDRTDPYILHTLSLALMLSERYAEAENWLRQAINHRFNPGFKTSYFLMGCCLTRAGRLEEARQAIANLDTDYVLILRARILFKENQRVTQEAVNFLKLALEKNPYRAGAKNLLARWERDL